MRVPLSFSWPLHEVWGGYLNPYYAQSGKCPDCEHGYDRAGGRPDANAALFDAQWYGTAPFDPVTYGAEPLSPHAPAIWDLARRNITSTREDMIIREARRLYEHWRYQWGHHLIQADVDALVADDRLWSLTCTWSKEHRWQRREDGHHPTAAEVNAWSFEGIGHDSLNASSCVRGRCEREGVPCECSRCSGSGKIWPSPEIKQRCKDWQKVQPPTGDGYQLWEDCSEGSPISPVFTTLDELCAWAEDNATTFGRERATKAEWKQMLDEGFVHAKMGGHIFL